MKINNKNKNSKNPSPSFSVAVLCPKAANLKTARKRRKRLSKLSL